MPVGAWHYATILCRLARNHAKKLEEKSGRRTLIWFQKLPRNISLVLQNKKETGATHMSNNVSNVCGRHQSVQQDIWWTVF